MIAVCMREDYCIHTINTFTQHLLPEVGTRVDNEGLAVNFDVNRAA